MLIFGVNRFQNVWQIVAHLVHFLSYRKRFILTLTLVKHLYIYLQFQVFYFIRNLAARLSLKQLTLLQYFLKIAFVTISLGAILNRATTISVQLDRVVKVGRDTGRENVLIGSRNLDFGARMVLISFGRASTLLS